MSIYTYFPDLPPHPVTGDDCSVWLQNMYHYYMNLNTTTIERDNIVRLHDYIIIKNRLTHTITDQQYWSMASKIPRN
jgi:hypothetical protein